MVVKASSMFGAVTIAALAGASVLVAPADVQPTPPPALQSASAVSLTAGFQVISYNNAASEQLQGFYGSDIPGVDLTLVGSLEELEQALLLNGDGTNIIIAYGDDAAAVGQVKGEHNPGTALLYAAVLVRDINYREGKAVKTGNAVATPVDDGVQTQFVLIKYDGAVHYPDNQLNLVAVINALLGEEMYGPLYATLDPTDPDASTITTDEYGNQHVQFDRGVPLVIQLGAVPVVGEPLVTVFGSSIKTLVDLGYGEDQSIERHLREISTIPRSVLSGFTQLSGTPSEPELPDSEGVDELGLQGAPQLAATSDDVLVSSAIAGERGAKAPRVLDDVDEASRVKFNLPTASELRDEIKKAAPKPRLRVSQASDNPVRSGLKKAESDARKTVAGLRSDVKKAVGGFKSSVKDTSDRLKKAGSESKRKKVSSGSAGGDTD